MSNCSICSTELKFFNSPTFGSGKLSGGGAVCTGCFKKINKINPKIASKLKNYSLTEVENRIEEKNQANKTKNSRLDEIKSHIQSLRFFAICRDYCWNCNWCN